LKDVSTILKSPFMPDRRLPDTVALPNYTGSVGFGEKHVQALQGRCGTLDVLDCMGAVDKLLGLKIAEKGPGKLFLAGGSHGGFLTAHRALFLLQFREKNYKQPHLTKYLVIGQYPELFTGAVIRNPVISGGDISGTDIPDWYYAEFGYEKDWPLVPAAQGQRVPKPNRLTGEMFDKLESMSPISYVYKVKADVLLQMGGSDKRVAPAQGLAYYHALKGKADVDIDMMWFEDQGHGLDGVESTRVVFETTRDFFNHRRK
jgi:acylaminoacyl-peptidase